MAQASVELSMCEIEAFVLVVLVKLFESSTVYHI